MFPRRCLSSGNTESAQAFLCLNSWISACTRFHKCCSQSLNTVFSPKRILEIFGRKVVLRLGIADGVRYACLSHCWGQQGVTFKLTQGTLATLTGGVEVQSLPKTFRDAVDVCLRLGLSFLWIDALCRQRPALFWSKKLTPCRYSTGQRGRLERSGCQHGRRL